MGLDIYNDLNPKYCNSLKAKLNESVLMAKPSIGFKDIAGNDYAKEIIK